MGWLLSSWPVLKAAYPLQIGEAFFTHEHCINGVALALRGSASEVGTYPTHTNGYADALATLSSWGISITGPGYDPEPLKEAIRSGKDLPEEQCGRVYVQGLSENASPPVALVFDKIFHPGDHTHFFHRFFARPRREVVMSDGTIRHVLEEDWPKFAREQVSRLVAIGFERSVVEPLFSIVGTTAKPSLLAKFALVAWLTSAILLGFSLGVRTRQLKDVR